MGYPDGLSGGLSGGLSEVAMRRWTSAACEYVYVCACGMWHVACVCVCACVRVCVCVSVCVRTLVVVWSTAPKYETTTG